jgi:hypothetical protein
MGIFDVYCVVCGCPFVNYAKDNIEDWKTLPYMTEVLKKSKQYDWLEKPIMMLANNKNIVCIGFKNSTDFFDKKGNIYEADANNLFMRYFSTIKDDVANKGIAIHSDCHKYVEKVLGKSITYGDIPTRVPVIHTKKQYVKQHVEIDYGSISEYQSQFFELEKLCKEHAEYMIESPMHNTKNAKRINKILNTMHMKKGRIGPTASATFYKEGDIKLGNNNKFWQVSGEKWKQLNEQIYQKTIKPNFINYTKIEKIPQLGEYNDELLFVKSFTRKPSTLTVIGTAQTIEKIER